MRVEVDVSDLTELTYFRDKRCEALEEVVRKNPSFTECVVKRQHFGEDWELDPFVIQDVDGEDLVSIDTWEVDALSESELLSYIDVQVSREQCDHSGSTLAFIMILVLLGPFAFIFTILEMFSSPGWISPFVITIALTSDIILFLSGLNFYLKRKRVISRKRQIDLVVARESSTFLDALRKLSSLSDIDEWKRKEYTSRLQLIEDSLAGGHS